MRTLLGRPLASWFIGGTTLLIVPCIWALADWEAAFAFFCLGVGASMLLSMKLKRHHE